MRKNENNVSLEGRIYQINLEEKLSGPTSKKPGTPFIKGSLDVCVDEEGLEVITVNINFPVMPTYNSGKENRNFKVLQKIISEGNTWLEKGKDLATKVSISGALGLNDFYNFQDNAFVKQMWIELSFINIINAFTKTDDIDKRKFSTDVVLTNCNRIEADPEKGINEDYLSLKGIIFDWNNSALPYDFAVVNPDGINYFEGLDINPKNPCYTKIWGRVVSKTVKKTFVEESAFGPSSVRTVDRKMKRYEVTGTSNSPYIYDDENFITAAELETALQNREVHLAEIKKRDEDYRASRTASSVTPAAAAPSATPLLDKGFVY